LFIDRQHHQAHHITPPPCHPILQCLKFCIPQSARRMNED
jgi:hypothetical protein